MIPPLVRRNADTARHSGAVRPSEAYAASMVRWTSTSQTTPSSSPRSWYIRESPYASEDVATSAVLLPGIRSELLERPIMDRVRILPAETRFGHLAKIVQLQPRARLSNHVKREKIVHGERAASVNSVKSRAVNGEFWAYRLPRSLNPACHGGEYISHPAVRRSKRAREPRSAPASAQQSARPGSGHGGRLCQRDFAEVNAADSTCPE